MMNFFHELLCVVGCGLALIGMLAGLLCSLPFVFWCMGVGLSMMGLGMGLDKLREMKRKANEYRWW
jgi:hypothetical protein